MRNLKIVLCFAFSLLFLRSLVFSQDMHREKYLIDVFCVEQTPSGSLYVSHTISEGQSLYGLSQFYHASLYDIKRINPELNLTKAFIGSKVKIPINKSHLITDLNQATRYALLEKMYYKVQKGDTPYGIAKRTFSIDVATLLNQNGISEDDIKEGTVLHIGWIPSVGLNHFSKPVKAKNVHYIPENESIRTEFASKGLSTSTDFVTEKGAAFWNKSAGEDFDYFVMHRTAPKNSIIEITNPDTGRTIYTKVLGRIPPKYPNKVIIVVSPKVAKQLGAINANFFVSLRFNK